MTSGDRKDAGGRLSGQMTIQEVPTNMSVSGRELAAILPSRFRVRHQLGEGTAGVVVAARDTILRRDVAIKLMRTGGAPDAQLLDEARAAAELRHPSIVTIFDVDPEGRFIVMELVDGETLQA